MKKDYYAIFDGNEKGQTWRTDEKSAISLAKDLRKDNPKVELLKLKRDDTVIERIPLD